MDFGCCLKSVKDTNFKANHNETGSAGNCVIVV